MGSEGGLGETSAVPSGRAARPDAASSVAPVSQGYERSLRPCLGTSSTPRRRGTSHQGLLVADLARAEIGSTYNQYEASTLLRDRLAAYLALRASAEILLVGEAAGYRGARVSGIPFTSERQLSGRPPAEASATIVHAVLAELGLEREVLLWNLVPTHPHAPGDARSNRRPTRAEVEAGRPFVHRLARGRRVVPVGRLAHVELGGQYVRHPSHGGAREFRAALVQLLG